MASTVDALSRAGIHEASSSKSTRRDEYGEDSAPELLDSDEILTDPETNVDKEKRGTSSTSKTRSGRTRKSRSPVGGRRSDSRDSSARRRQTADSRPTRRAGDENPSNELEFGTLLGIAVAVVVFAAGAFSLVNRAMRGTEHPVDRSYRVDIFRQQLRQLKDTYPGQPDYNWQIIRSSAVEVLNASEAQHGPAVLLILAPSHNENLAKKIGNDVALALSYAFEDGGAYGEIEFEELGFTEDTIAAKHIVDSRCKSTFVDKKQHVILAPHIESWNPELAMMLHPLCDYENPLYKDTAIVLTAFTKENVGDTERSRYDRVAEEVLNKAWDDMDTNQRHAIISRVTVNVIVLQDEHKVFSGVNKQ